jgi:cell division initiation protein
MKPIDIQKKEFNKAMRGYSTSEVDSFLEGIAEDMEQLLKENEEMSTQMKHAESELDKFNRIEKTLKDALIVAQSTAEDVVHNANVKAEHIVEAAEHKAEKILNDASNRIIEARKEYEEAKKDVILFKTRFKTLLSAQLEAVEESLVDDE